MIRRIVLAICVVLAPAFAAAAPRIIKKEVPYSSMGTGASTTGTFTIWTVSSPKVYIYNVWINRDTDLSGGAVSAATLAIGKSGSTTKYLAATDVFTGVSNGWDNAVIGTTRGTESAGTAIIGTLTTTTANTSALTAGKVTVYLLVDAAY